MTGGKINHTHTLAFIIKHFCAFQGNAAALATLTTECSFRQRRRAGLHRVYSHFHVLHLVLLCRWCYYSGLYISFLLNREPVICISSCERNLKYRKLVGRYRAVSSFQVLLEKQNYVG